MNTYINLSLSLYIYIYTYAYVCIYTYNYIICITVSSHGFNTQDLKVQVAARRHRFPPTRRVGHSCV